MAKGILFVDKPDNIRVISKESIMVAKMVEQIVEASGLAPYDRGTNTGFWRIVLFKESKNTKQCLVSVVITDQTKLKEGEV